MAINCVLLDRYKKFLLTQTRVRERTDKRYLITEAIIFMIAILIYPINKKKIKTREIS